MITMGVSHRASSGPASPPALNHSASRGAAGDRLPSPSDHRVPRTVTPRQAGLTPHGSRHICESNGVQPEGPQSRHGAPGAPRVAAWAMVRTAGRMVRAASLALLSGANIAAAELDFSDMTIEELVGHVQPPPGIKGEDGRRVADSSVYPWTALGRVNVLGRGFCTGFMVAPATVLTAAHCVMDEISGDPLPAAMLHFVAGYSFSEWKAHSPVESVMLGQASGELAGDYAFLKLSSDISGATGVLAMAGAPIGPFESLSLLQVGYSRDRESVLTIDAGCGGKLDPGQGLIFHTCDATSGASGSALMLMSDTGPLVVGLHVATSHDNGTTLGIAIPAWLIGDAADTR